ncbi:MAG: polymerase sigma factor FliA [Epulopiscium sp.]|jgi:RNA polymerase sigma factor for flagellar operon FliA|uniref:RNA polymerase sigma factor n=1 Tax=Defluviitalea raffinosedens TaxID=1450156 RepID=A0A7C8LL49_9FIRM|nr:FliA/WhiG family RNA polymerase sigma factor [Defluviitalea raffinosedens]MBZ4669260.1 sigD1 [Defluviitaleaceae bacterium]MDK2787175.1 polymerase sigma factor FliA [Candidatus Epulonipiscium sp.]KAE9637064.1 FliA/WhiG family RNA polymerase sigma factor [Defluviitalea raffinosedens]MBM7685179.1 RNA polymerase sigma factor for flagellar operon FliA [Defluviitalea raffinosedens]HHW67382.1 FliA/WhiG family RNA polymerase sigma factor [Candidatus Epulonipiscium sp.]
MTEKNLQELWEQYEKTNQPSLKEKLIIEYAPLVKYVAGRLNIYLGQNVEYEDLISYGIFGLIDAIDKFDLSKGVKFETYASLRIRGAILDSIRKLDWVPRSLRQKYKQIEKICMELETELGRSATDEELAEKIGISKEEVQETLKKINLLSLISLEEYVEQNNEPRADTDFPRSAEQPETYIEKQELKRILKEAIEKLPEREQKILFFYYFEELTLKEISAIMGVSESRISQLHTKAITRLKGKLGRYRSILFELF